MIYSKTEAGLNAIKDRKSGLTPRQRSFLILCDGKRDSDEVLKNTAGLGVTTADIETLVSLQMLGGGSAASTQGAAPAENLNSGSMRSPGRIVSPEELKILVRRATRQLEALLGPGCEPLSLKLEKCRTYDEFAIEIVAIRRVLVSTRSEKIADEFVASALV